MLKTRRETTTPDTWLQIEVYYSLGGYSCFTGNENKRGYWLSVKPVEIKDGFIKYAAFSGTKTFLLEVARKSVKAEQQAEAIAQDKIETLVAHVLAERGLTLKK